MQAPAEEKLIELEPGQVIPITQNRKRLKYTIYDKDYDSDQDIEFIEEEQPQLLLKRGIVSREIKTRDVNDTSYRNLGNFIIYADINTDTTSITIDDNTPSTYSIEQYNQENGTNYIGFNSITLDINTMSIPEYDITKFTFVTGGSPNYNMFSNNYTIYKSDGQVTSEKCYILEYNNTIIINYGNPPLNSYYCTSSISSVDSNLANKIIYDNQVLAYNEKTSWYGGRPATNHSFYYPLLTLYGKLTNLPNSNS